ncbi:hypothetical protein ROJ8625_03793 [Roseivivax jejudonensis]|uniref:Uncharacterized protein n=1 Tax=Roseivivax jejudonensis TaxID=1529041 RepID=A0A1X7A6R6_9RHOB|nr:hypothetical protein [Roseivivax jejudonensis]SLN72099.1 hypothetical protein ROJ8625_03793 [Roseivivax jejudonensis]
MSRNTLIIAGLAVVVIIVLFAGFGGVDDEGSSPEEPAAETSE